MQRKTIKQKIYVIDDDLSVRKALKRLLGTITSDVETFASAQEFLDVWDRSQEVCLILDVYLGGTSGIELYHSLLKEGYKIPVVFITGHDSEWIRNEVKKLADTEFLRKPFDDQSLFNAIDKVIR